MTKLRTRYANTVTAVLCPNPKCAISAILRLNQIKTILAILAANQVISTATFTTLHLSSLMRESNLEFKKILPKLPHIRAAPSKPSLKLHNLLRGSRLIEDMILFIPQIYTADTIFTIPTRITKKRIVNRAAILKENTAITLFCINAPISKLTVTRKNTIRTIITPENIRRIEAILIVI